MPADKLAEAIARVRRFTMGSGSWDVEDVLAVCDAAARVGEAERSFRYMISCEEYDERYVGFPCGKEEPDPPGVLLHRCMICQIAKARAERDDALATLSGIERLSRAGPWLEISHSEALGHYAIAFGKQVHTLARQSRLGDSLAVAVQAALAELDKGEGNA